MPDQTLINGTTQIDWKNQQLWLVTWLFMAGTLARMLISPDPFNLKRFLGEMTVAGISAVIFYAGGVLQGLQPLELIFYGGLIGLGGLRGLEWVLKIATKLRNIV